MTDRRGHARKGRRLRCAAAVVAALGLLPAALAAQGSYEDLQAFSSVLNYVRLNYVDSVSYHGMVRAAIAGMLQSLDPHSRIETKADFERYVDLMQGRLASSGLTLELVDGRPVVLGIVHGAPADRAGVLPGDRLLSINDTSALGIPTRALELRLSGDQGAKFRLRLERGPALDPDTLRVSFKLAPVKPPAVSEALLVDSTTAVVRLESFERPDAIAEVSKTLDDLKHRGMKRLVLDLRWNPGGLVQGASQLAGLFLPARTLVFRTKGRRSADDQEFVTDQDGKWKDLPLAVLVNEWTASASEAFAGAMQDHDRAIIVGRRTFGKALMQRDFILPDGDVIWLTVARIMSPSGRVIQRQYHGLGALQYDLLAGHGGAPADTDAVYHTDAGRVVRGGGGILPDSIMPPGSAPPHWWVAAADSGILLRVADSVSQTLGPAERDRQAWLSLGPAGWRARLLGPFLAACRAELHVEATLDASQADQVAVRLAARAAQVRWGDAAGSAVEVSADPEVASARRALAAAGALLAHPRP